MKKQDAFEASFAKFDFAPLVQLGIAIAAFLSGRTRDSGKTRGNAAIAGETLGSAA